MRYPTLDEFAQAEALLDTLLDLPGTARTAYLAERGVSPSVRRIVEALLEGEAQADALLDTETPALARSMLEAVSATLAADARPPVSHAGSYRLTREIGRGGTSVVYLAERDDGAFEQTVAVKLLRAGFDTRALRRRFRAERQILASLDHAHIARVFDGGMTENGHPYLVMEYVEGEPLDVYAERRALSVEARLRLFLDVCAAIAYAHRNLIVHRDLKPSNILVAEPEGGPPLVKLLDFGIAKLLDAPEAARTQTGGRWMTPDYAAPEQVRGEAITTATDVYQLGAVLYKLLTGRRVVDGEHLSVFDVERAVCEQAPPPPSRVAPQGRRLRGNLDAIVAKALRKEPDARYASVAALTDDLERHLDDLPVVARRGTAGYRLRAFVRRYRWGLAATATAGVLLATLGTFHALEVTKERDRARLEAAKATQATRLLHGLFRAYDSGEALSDTVTARTLLERGLRDAERLNDQPAVQAQMFIALGDIYHSLGHYDQAAALSERVLRLHEAVYGRTAPETIEVLNELAELQRERSAFDASVALYRDALARQRGARDADPLQLAETLYGLADVQRRLGDYAAATASAQESYALRERRLGGGDLATISSLHQLAVIAYNQGDYETAEPLYHEVAQKRSALLGEEHHLVASAKGNLAALLLSAGKLRDAEARFREVLRLQERALGANHPDVARTLNNLGLTIRDQGRLGEAEPLFRASLRIKRERLGPDHLQVGLSLYSLAGLLAQRSAYADAEALFLEARAIFQRTLPEDHSFTGRALMGLGSLYLAQDQPEQAEPLLREGLRIQRTSLGADHWETAEAQSLLGESLIRLGHYHEAGTLLRTSLRLLLRARGLADPLTQETQRRLSALSEAQNRTPP